MNQQVTDYIRNAPEAQQAIMVKLRNIIHENVPGVTEEFKWGRPVFKTWKDFAYFKTAKQYLTLGFFNFQQLRDEQNRMEGTGKEMRHIKLKRESDIDEALLREWFGSASKF